MNENEHQDGASAAEDLGVDEDSSYREGSNNETDSESSRRRSGSSSSSSVSYDSEESFADDGSSTYSSDGSSHSSASSSQHSCSSSSGDDSSSNSSSSMEEDRNNNDSKMNSPSSLMAAATDSTITTSPSSSAGITTATSTNRTFQRGVLPISINTTGHHGIAVNNNVLTQRRGKKSLESNGEQEQCIQQDKDDIRHDSKSNNDNRHNRKRSSKRHRKHKNQQQEQDSAIQCCMKFICCQTKKRSTQILIASFFLWILAQFYYFFYLDLRNYFIGNTKELYDEFFRPQRTGEGDYYQGRGRITNEYFHDYSNKYPGHMTQEEREAAREEARKKIGSVNDDDGFDKDGFRKDTGGRKRNRRSRRKKGSRDSEGSTKVERLKPGCKALEWHSYHFPNCNEIHEIDLQAAVRHPREKYIRQKAKAMSDDEGNNATKSTTTSLTSSSFPWGFVSNGLWRDVFSCDPRGEVSGSVEAESFPMPPAVLKIMKREHPYDQRNFQRHRRDALVMERLSSSHHLVPIYGYCANTVLTQAISHTLDEVIYAREYETTKKWNPRIGYESKPPLESWMGKDENGELLATRETELGRIHLALGVFRGLVDLHEGDGKTDMEWLPVIHADLQAKQYLVDSNTGKVYLNDFNRCRFIAKKDNSQIAAVATSNGTLLAASNVTNDAATSHPIQTTCPVYIPTAPGYSRSPEEYNNGALTEKLDVYSAGNILYGIITGKKPWNGERGSHIRQGISVGKRPEIDPAIRDAEGTVDAELVRLLDRVYEGDPDERASAKEVVMALEELLEKVNEGK